MSAFPLSLPIAPRTTCGAVNAAEIVTLGVLAMFVAVMVVLGQPLTVAAGVAGWLVTVAGRASTTGRATPRAEIGG